MMIRAQWPTVIVLHCSDTEDGFGTDREAIRKYHVEVNHWDDIGYHFVLERIANSYALLPGRDPKLIGAHVRGHNANSIGLCVVGKYDDHLPDETFFAAVSALSELCMMYGLTAAAIKGHRELDSNKTCPGKAWDLDKVRRAVASYLERINRVGIKPREA